MGADLRTKTESFGTNLILASFPKDKGLNFFFYKTSFFSVSKLLCYRNVTHALKLKSIRRVTEQL